MEVSVIIPMYNAKETIQKTLQALLGQSMPVKEIIVVDDGSTDGSFEAVQQMDDGRIRPIRQEHGGTSKAKNRGIREADAEYLMFVDADDTVADDYVETHMSRMGECDIVCSGMEIVYPLRNAKVIVNSHRKYVGRIVGVVELLHLLEDGEVFNVDVAKVYSKSRLLTHGIFFDEGMQTGEDLQFNCAYFQHIKNGLLLPYCGYQYIRLENGSLVSRHDPDLDIVVEKMIRAREKLYGCLGVQDKDYFRSRLMGTSLSAHISIIPNLYRKGCMLSAKERRRCIRRVEQEVRGYPVFAHANRQEAIMHWVIRRCNPMAAERIFSLLFWLKGRFAFIYRKVF